MIWKLSWVRSIFGQRIIAVYQVAATGQSSATTCLDIATEARAKLIAVYSCPRRLATGAAVHGEAHES